MAVQVLDGVEVVRSDPLLHPAVLPHHISRGIRGYDFHCHSAKKKKKIAETSIFSPISQFSSDDFYPASLPSVWSCCIHCDNSVQYKSGTLLHLTSNWLFFKIFKTKANKGMWMFGWCLLLPYLDLHQCLPPLTSTPVKKQQHTDRHTDD